MKTYYSGQIVTAFVNSKGYNHTKQKEKTKWVLEVSIGRIHMRERSTYLRNYQSIRELIKEIAEYKGKIGIAAVIGATLLLLINFFIVPPVYESTAKLYILNREDNSQTIAANISISRMLTNDYREVLRDNHILEEVIKRLNLNMTTSELRKSIIINTPKDTRMLEVSVIDADKALCAKIVNTLIAVSEEVFPRISQVGKINVLEYGTVPAESELPNIPRIIILGSSYGSLLSIVIIMKRIKYREKIITEEDVEYWLGLSTLGVIPLEKEMCNQLTKIQSTIG